VTSELMTAVKDNLTQMEMMKIGQEAI